VLSFLLFFNFGSIILLSLVPKELYLLPKRIALWSTNLLLGCAVVLWLKFNSCSAEFQFMELFSWFDTLNIYVVFGVDGISIFFLLLTLFIFPFCVLSVWENKEVKWLLVLILSIEFFLVLAFTVLDLFLFCLFFESLLIPMFFIILVWGGRERRIKAITYFFMYTVFGSVFLFSVLFLLFFEYQTTSYFVILTNVLDFKKQCLVWFLLFIVFAIKIPIFPFHIWLPEAHVEAPTVGSVILAGLLLKLGGYGMLRFLFLFENARLYFQPLVMTLCLLSILFASFMSLRQLDMKRIIAYSSIAHMNFALLGYFSNTIYGLVGGALLMVSHGLVSSALFLLIGVLYERHHSRSILYYGGLVQIMPLYSLIYIIFIISNFSFPGTSNFCGELLVFLGLGQNAYKSVLLIAGVSTFFGLLTSILLYNRLIFGNIKGKFLLCLSDLTRREFFLFLPLVVCNFILGFYPSPLISILFFSIKTLL
jgi:NADH-quinone oxidoreductase subunit M